MIDGFSSALMKISRCVYVSVVCVLCWWSVSGRTLLTHSATHPASQPGTQSTCHCVTSLTVCLIILSHVTQQSLLTTEWRHHHISHYQAATLHATPSDTHQHITNTIYNNILTFVLRSIASLS